MRVGSKWLIVGVGLCTILSTGAIAPAAERVGMHIGYTVEGEAGGKHGTLTEAWILPQGRVPDEARMSPSPAVRTPNTVAGVRGQSPVEESTVEQDPMRPAVDN